MRAERTAFMEAEMLDVYGAAAALGPSTTTIYILARQGEIAATRVGREWRFSRSNLMQWVAHGRQADAITKALRHGKVGKRRS